MMVDHRHINATSALCVLSFLSAHIRSESEKTSLLERRVKINLKHEKHRFNARGLGLMHCYAEHVRLHVTQKAGEMKKTSTV
jgi:hypothetical protein